MSAQIKGTVNELTILITVLTLIATVGFLIYRYVLKIKVVEVKQESEETGNGREPSSSSPPGKRNPDFRITA